MNHGGHSAHGEILDETRVDSFMTLAARRVTPIVRTHDTALGARARRQLHMEDGELRVDSGRTK